MALNNRVFNILNVLDALWVVLCGIVIILQAEDNSPKKKFSLQREACVSTTVPFWSLVVCSHSQTQQEKLNMLHRLCSHRPLFCMLRGIREEPAERKQHVFWTGCNKRTAHLLYARHGVPVLGRALYVWHVFWLPRVKTLHLFLSLFTQMTNHSGGGVGQTATLDM